MLRGVAAAKSFLGLSDQQVQQLTQLRRDEQAAVRPLREQLQAKTKELNAARQAANPNPGAIGQLVLDVQNLRKQVRAINEDYHNKALALLDSAQTEKLSNLEQAARRASTVRPVVNGATALNLLIRPLPRRGTGAALP